VDVSSVLSTGVSAARSRYVADDDELGKRITAHLIAGDQIAMIDNVPSGKSVGWAALDSALTADTWTDRELGKSRVVRLPMECMFFATGNNIGISGDAARRTLKIRLEAQVERPEERTGFKWHPIIPRVKEERPFLLGKALNAVRAYLLAGRPDMGLTDVGSFEGWSEVVRSAIVWLDLADPVEAMASHAQGVDETAEAHMTLLACWKDLDDMGDGLTCSQILGQLQRRGCDLEALREAISVLCPTRNDDLPTSRKLSSSLKSVSGRIRTVGGAPMRLVSKMSRSHTLAWCVKTVESENFENSEKMTDFQNDARNEKISPANLQEKPATNSTDICMQGNGAYRALSPSSSEIVNDKLGSVGETTPVIPSNLQDDSEDDDYPWPEENIEDEEIETDDNVPF
jgi:hypothetical protein